MFLPTGLFPTGYFPVGFFPDGGGQPQPTARRYHLVPAAAVVRISTARPTLAPHEAKIRPPRPPN